MFCTIGLLTGEKNWELTTRNSLKLMGNSRIIWRYLRYRVVTGSISSPIVLNRKIMQPIHFVDSLSSSGGKNSWLKPYVPITLASLLLSAWFCWILLAYIKRGEPKLYPDCQLSFALFSVWFRLKWEVVNNGYPRSCNSQISCTLSSFDASLNWIINIIVFWKRYEQRTRTIPYAHSQLSWTKTPKRDHVTVRHWNNKTVKICIIIFS